MIDTYFISLVWSSSSRTHTRTVEWTYSNDQVGNHDRSQPEQFRDKDPVGVNERVEGKEDDEDRGGSGDTGQAEDLHYQLCATYARVKWV